MFGLNDQAKVCISMKLYYRYFFCEENPVDEVVQVRKTAPMLGDMTEFTSGPSLPHNRPCGLGCWEWLYQGNAAVY